MADRDNYRGYGSPSGRPYEARDYDRGSGRGRDERSSYGGDRDRGREEWRGGGRGDDNDRGFFERAGEEIRSWFGDDDDRGDRGRPESRGEWRGQSPERDSNRDGDRGYGWGSMMSGRGGQDRDRDFRQDAREPWGGGDRGGQQRYPSAGNESSGSRVGVSEAPTRDRGRGGFLSGMMGGGQDRSRSRSESSHPHDEHYHEWRQQQLSELDRDYDEYRRENRDKFHSEFTSWRGQRQQQRASIRQVREHMEVVGSDGQPVGTVDKVSGDRIILTKDGPMAGGHHHSIPCGWLQAVDQERVTINKTAEQAREKWTDEENRRALFESDNHRTEDGPHILDRSFSGTYER